MQHSHHHNRRNDSGSMSRSTNSELFHPSNGVDRQYGLPTGTGVVTRERRAGTVGADELTRRLEKLRDEKSKTSLQDFHTAARAESRFTVTPSVMTLYNEDGRQANTNPQTTNTESKGNPNVESNDRVDIRSRLVGDKKVDLKSLLGNKESKIKKFQSMPSLSRNGHFNDDMEMFLVDPPPVTRRPTSVHFDESTFSSNHKNQEQLNVARHLIPEPTDSCNVCYLSGGSSSSGNSSTAGSVKGSPHPSRGKISDVADALLKPNEKNPEIDKNDVSESRDSNAATGKQEGLRPSSSEPILTLTTENGNEHILTNEGKNSKSSFELKC